MFEGSTRVPTPQPRAPRRCRRSGTQSGPRSGATMSPYRPSAGPGSRQSRGPEGRATECARTGGVEKGQTAGQSIKSLKDEPLKTTDLVTLQRFEQHIQHRSNGLQRWADGGDEREHGSTLLLQLGRVSELPHLEDLRQKRKDDGEGRRSVEIRHGPLDAARLRRASRQL